MEEQKKYSLSLVLSVYNEEDILEESMKKILHSLEEQNLDYEIVIVDDGSTDNSLQIIKQIAQGNEKIIIVENKVNLNQGISMLRGFKVASKELITYNGIDIPIPVEKTRQFIEELGDKDLLVIQREKSTGYSFWRHILSAGNRFIRKVLFPFMLSNVYDMNFGQIYRKKYLDSIWPNAKSPAFVTAEFVYRAILRNLKVK